MLSIDDLLHVKSREELRSLLRAASTAEMTAAVEGLHAEILSGIVVEPGRAHRLADLVRQCAEISGDEYVHGLADRCEGHVRYGETDHAAAVRCYESAVERFERLGRETEVARTLSGAIQSLIYLGLDEQAILFSERARAIFEKEGDELRLARLDSNLGNIYYRQDRYHEARSLYKRAFDRLMRLDRPKDAAAVLCNMAVASTGTGDFDAAAAEYARSRELADREGLRSLAAQQDYNIAYLHFLRGHYTQALRLYRDARRHSEEIGDEYHAALCDLDQSEVYLDLNLIDESVNLARGAALRFRELRMRYEQAKAVTFAGIGEHCRQNNRQALVLFSEARSLFLQSRNPIWPAIVDFYRSILLRDLGQTKPALKLAARAGRVFVAESLLSRVALVKVLIGEIALDGGRLDKALRSAELATRGLNPDDHPMVFFHAEYLRGRALKLNRSNPEAFAAFQRAAEMLESIRARLAGDELRLAFVRNKLDVYAQLMLLSGEIQPVDKRGSLMFEFIEKAKARSLADRLAFLETNPPQPQTSNELAGVRQQLNALYREISVREIDRRHIRNLRSRILVLEQRLSEVVRERALEEKTPSEIVDWTPLAWERVAASLPPRAQIVEYFIAEQHFWVAVIGTRAVEIRKLGPVDPVFEAVRLLAFQLSRARHHAGDSRLRSIPLGQAATVAHLQALHELLIQPIESLLDAEDLVIVPHGLLHRLPFQALHDGRSFLIDRFTVSYCPSATVFSLCRRKQPVASNRTLLLGVPDDRSPAIVEEIQSLSTILPNPTVLIGEWATSAALASHAHSSRYIHIAAHGEFRPDNPLFSAVRSADGQVNVIDLYGLRLNAELVTLSGCSTAEGSIAGGDELVGLARGLMHAGARAVLLALWEIHDPSTAAFMRHFYEELLLGKTPALALRNAMLNLRRAWPEPYYWAPFGISGDALQRME